MGHTHSSILVHVIFGTKGRRNLIAQALRQRLYRYMAGVARGEFGRALKIGGTENHIHGLLSLSPSVSVAEAMRKWKSLSSRWVHDTFPAQAEFAWQTGYGAFSVSQSNSAGVVRYVEQQQEHHRSLSFEEEFIALLKRHRVDYDPQHLWD